MGTQRYFIEKMDKSIVMQLGTFVLILDWRVKLTLRRYWAA